MSCTLRLPKINWVAIIFCFFFKHLLYIYKSSAMACIIQAGLQQSRLKAKCSYAILLSLCSAVNGSLQHRTGLYSPYGHSQNITVPLEKAKQSCSGRHPEAVQSTQSMHLPHVSHPPQTAANISCCKRNKVCSCGVPYPQKNMLYNLIR